MSHGIHVETIDRSPTEQVRGRRADDRGSMVSRQTSDERSDQRPDDQIARRSGPTPLDRPYCSEVQELGPELYIG